MLLACVRSGMGIIAQRLADCPLRLIHDPQGRCIPIGFLPPVSRQMRACAIAGKCCFNAPKPIAWGGVRGYSA
ncbi:hypothetical protein [Komagataeibacter saccharivorans]|uniref:hypothetical protein n=1 Tax=Komagataeibacter saccharivorans TaxID=265959 RepID=UPI0015E0EDDB|nr:hypothetical protein [Komagataeibacter saccharivorans]